MVGPTFSACTSLSPSLPRFAVPNSWFQAVRVHLPPTSRCMVMDHGAHRLRVPL
ncbi:hypothetical protein PAXRUDRAFT_823537 [Paxillus rubicundulus Ve08.2h10]|uniref:Unplaced genomic scaffold scaffold_60, whole genome shotgun sequence n=1 Tax=Paxillus rubicundulus Ve08.2h10 TaxID=930991 RepID=A0A0D0EC50_9AGAM|nr:hypothetical protein PAXRUDRAFT_823537 [Paxillus rubicundulus Ve08.2h10]